MFLAMGCFTGLTGAYRSLQVLQVHYFSLRGYGRAFTGVYRSYRLRGSEDRIGAVLAFPPHRPGYAGRLSPRGEERNDVERLV
jgi:hypothetical protein